MGCREVKNEEKKIPFALASSLCRCWKPKNHPKKPPKSKPVAILRVTVREKETFMFDQFSKHSSKKSCSLAALFSFVGSTRTTMERKCNVEQMSYEPSHEETHVISSTAECSATVTDSDDAYALVGIADWDEQTVYCPKAES